MQVWLGTISLLGDPLGARCATCVYTQARALVYGGVPQGAFSSCARGQILSCFAGDCKQQVCLPLLPARLLVCFAGAGVAPAFLPPPTLGNVCPLVPLDIRNASYVCVFLWRALSHCIPRSRGWGLLSKRNCDRATDACRCGWAQFRC